MSYLKLIDEPRSGLEYDAVLTVYDEFRQAVYEFELSASPSILHRM